jgi:hypothetical protein
MPEIGFQINVPNGDFAFDRAYAFEIGLRSSGFTVTWVDNQVTLLEPTVGAYYIVLIVDERIWQWSSNVYTLGFFFRQLYYVVPPVPTHNPAGAVVSWETALNHPRPIIMVDPFLTSTTPLYHPLPPAPADWWSS